jgi:tripartite-type tricarboxylate transporter receptor subunit TctC
MKRLQSPPALRRTLLQFAATSALTAVSTTWSGLAMAQESAWPSKPIKLIINFPPGSSPDVLGRAVATPLAQALGQPVVVENRAGAGGLVGADAAAKSPGDGQTLLMAAGSTMVISPHLTAKMPFDVSRDLLPVAAVARIELFLVVRSDSPFNTFADFLRHAKANPGRLSFGSPGNGTTPHLAGEMLKSQAGFFAVHVPYRGSSPALQDLLSGQVDYLLDPGIAFPHIRAGKLRLLAVASTKRAELFPDTPTLSELGLKGFDAGTTHGIYAPAGTPAAVIDRINREVNRILANSSAIQPIKAIGAAATPLSSAEFTTVLANDSRRYAAIVRERKITAD